MKISPNLSTLRQGSKPDLSVTPCIIDAMMDKWELDNPPSKHWKHMSPFEAACGSMTFTFEPNCMWSADVVSDADHIIKAQGGRHPVAEAVRSLPGHVKLELERVRRQMFCDSVPRSLGYHYIPPTPLDEFDF